MPHTIKNHLTFSRLVNTKNDEQSTDSIVGLIMLQSTYCMYIGAKKGYFDDLANRLEEYDQIIEPQRKTQPKKFDFDFYYHQKQEDTIVFEGNLRQALVKLLYPFQVITDQMLRQCLMALKELETNPDNDKIVFWQNPTNSFTTTSSTPPRISRRMSI